MCLFFFSVAIAVRQGLTIVDSYSYFTLIRISSVFCRTYGWVKELSTNIQLFIADYALCRMSGWNALGNSGVDEPNDLYTQWKEVIFYIVGARRKTKKENKNPREKYLVLILSPMFMCMHIFRKCMSFRILVYVWVYLLT